MALDIHTNIPLKNYTTMRLGGPAQFMADVHSVDELSELLRNAQAKQLPLFVLGGGSNVIARDEGFRGLVIRIRIPGFEVVSETETATTVKIGAGENWDSVVARTVDMRLSGIEAMSAIPGTAGAAPVQNVGAYGQEIADTLIALEAIDTATNQLVQFQNSDCQFSYRSSRFRDAEPGRFIITSITLELWKSLPQPPFYDSLQAYFDEHHVTLFTHQTVRDAVRAIRAHKLPDPSSVANSGSFFKNPIVESWQLDQLKAAHPEIRAYDMGEKRHKLYAGWLIEQAGLRGKTLHGIRVYEHNALVLVNDAASGYQDLAAAREEICDAVRDRFQIVLEQEPLELV